MRVERPLESVGWLGRSEHGGIIDERRDAMSDMSRSDALDVLEEVREHVKDVVLSLELDAAISVLSACACGKPIAEGWTLPEAIENYNEGGCGGVTVWRERVSSGELCVIILPAEGEKA